MLAYITRRIWQMIPTMLGVVLLIFFLFNWVGGILLISLLEKWQTLNRLKIFVSNLG